MKTPTQAELQQSMEHLAFEFYHFGLYGRQIQRRIAGGNKTYHESLHQAVGYEFLVHFRTLLGFFFATSGGDDDLLVSDFGILPGFAAALPNRSAPAWVRGVRVQLNKRLAHITSLRWTERAPAMNDYHEHFAEICSLISSFKAALPSDLRRQIESFEAKWAQRDSDL